MRDAPRRFTQPALLFVALALVAVLGWSNRSLAKENGALWDRVVRPYRGYVVRAFTARSVADGREFVVAGGDSATTQVLFVFSKECHFCAQTLPAWLAIDSALAGDRLQVHSWRGAECLARRGRRARTWSAVRGLGALASCESV